MIYFKPKYKQTEKQLVSKMGYHLSLRKSGLYCQTSLKQQCHFDMVSLSTIYSEEQLS